MTCLSASSLGANLTEAMFAGKSCYTISGFVDVNNTIKVYKYTINQFIVGNIDLGKQTICITFDERVTDNVLGMDIISQLTYYQEKDSDTLYLFRDTKEAAMFLNGVISRVYYKVAHDLYYVVIDDIRCYFRGNQIKRDAGGFFIRLRNQKCYLK